MKIRKVRRLANRRNLQHLELMPQELMRIPTLLTALGMEIQLILRGADVAGA